MDAHPPTHPLTLVLMRERHIWTSWSLRLAREEGVWQGMRER